MTSSATLAPAPMRAVWDGMRTRLSAWRDRLLIAPGFQAWAAQAPLFRRVAQREADALFDLCAGFVYSQILLAVVKLELLERLREGPLSLADVGAGLPLPADGLRTLVDAAIALKLLERRSGGRIGLGPRGAVLLSNPGLRELVLHHELLYADLADPVALLRGDQQSTRLSSYWAYARADVPAALDDAAVARYSRLMALSQDIVSAAVIAAYDFSAHRRLLDVGGGEGRFVCNVLRAAPALQARVFDLPAVAARADARLAEAGLASRAQGIGGNFMLGIPAGDVDVITLVRVLHDHDDEPARCLLRNVRAALGGQGTLVVAESMIDTDRGALMGAAYFGMYLQAMRSGRPRTPGEVSALLREAGFTAVELRPATGPLPLTLAIART